MEIGGLKKVSLIGYPRRICAVIFTRGCNFRCPYCHNPELVDPALYKSSLTEEEVFSFLEKRRGKLDAVTISGGEPTIQPDLFRVIQRIKAMGYLVKIDTNGSHPDVLEKLMCENLVDYIAMDIKAPLEKYGKITGTDTSTNDIRRCIEMIMAADVPYEFRTTVVKSMLAENDIIAIGSLIGNAHSYVLQKFVPTIILDPNFLTQPTFTDEELAVIQKELETKVSHVTVR